jgi:hypothetical protein
VDILSGFQQNLMKLLLQHIHFTLQWTEKHLAQDHVLPPAPTGMQHHMLQNTTLFSLPILLVVSLLKMLYQIFLISLHGFWGEPNS